MIYGFLNKKKGMERYRGKERGREREKPREKILKQKEKNHYWYVFV